MTIRAFYQAAKVEDAQPPFDTIYLKVTYPAKISGSEMENNFGTFAANHEKAPFPVVIFMNGFNCGAEMYNWLAIALAQRYLVVVPIIGLQKIFLGKPILVLELTWLLVNQKTMAVSLLLPLYQSY